MTDLLFTGNGLRIPTGSTPESNSPLLWIEEYNAATPKLGEAPRHIPGARIVLDSADAARLRLSGLLAALGPEGAYHLLSLLSFLHPNGTLHPSVLEIAAALGVTERQARERMLPLQKTLWDGLPLLREVTRAPAENASGGRDYYVVSPRLVGFRREVSPPTDPSQPHPAGREAVIAWSRSQYAHPREEAERLVSMQLGLPTDADRRAEKSLLIRLIAVGVSAPFAERLVAAEPQEEIERQLAWLPARKAKDPGRFLVAAVRGRYGPPANGGAD